MNIETPDNPTQPEIENTAPTMHDWAKEEPKKGNAGKIILSIILIAVLIAYYILILRPGQKTGALEDRMNTSDSELGALENTLDTLEQAE